MTQSIVDIGCGPNKVNGSFGIDHYPYPGVDAIIDLDAVPWPIKSDTFSAAHVRHVIEHVADVKLFLSEIHRVCVHGALVHFTTPHYSSLDSWKDPTHRWHFSSAWHSIFTDEPNYLSKQVPIFKHQSTSVLFRNNVRSYIPKLMIRLKGIEWWEKNYAFQYNAKNIETLLSVVK